MAVNEKPIDAEDQYFAAEDVEKLRRLALQQQKALAEQEKEGLRALHYMKCPKCGLDLQTIHHLAGNVDVDVCLNCNGIWLDAGELETLQKHTTDPRRTVMGAVLNLFKGK